VVALKVLRVNAVENAKIDATRLDFCPLIVAQDCRCRWRRIVSVASAGLSVSLAQDCQFHRIVDVVRLSVSYNCQHHTIVGDS
jgi:hypothetical protein